MMSNCAFWSASGELLAVHGVNTDDPRSTFATWAAAIRLPPGRLVSLSRHFPSLPCENPGWQALPGAPVPRKGKPPRHCDVAAPVATPAPALDTAACRLFPPQVDHEKFRLRSWPTWVTTVRLEREEGPEGWYAALDAASTSRFLLRIVPHRGRLPGDGWRNMLAWSLKTLGLRLVPLNGLPRSEVLAEFPAWEYRVEAGRGVEAAAWDFQAIPSRKLLSEWAGGMSDPWEATALLRWVRPTPPAADSGEPPEGEPSWATLFGRWPVADARLVVQNVLNTLPGGASSSAALFFDALTLPPGADGRSLVRCVPQPGLPLALLSTLFGRRAWHEIERAKRSLPPTDEVAAFRSEVLGDLDQRLAEGRLLWSSEAEELWNTHYREPVGRLREGRLVAIRWSGRWADVLAGDPRVTEGLLRGLDVTDAALCLRDAPDARWRRFVTARREDELRAELEFCRLWDQRGELTVERQLEAWRAWDELVANLSLNSALN